MGLVDPFFGIRKIVGLCHENITQKREILSSLRTAGIIVVMLFEKGYFSEASTNKQHSSSETVAK